MMKMNAPTKRQPFICHSKYTLFSTSMGHLVVNALCVCACSSIHKSAHNTSLHNLTLALQGQEFLVDTGTFGLPFARGLEFYSFS